MGIGISSLLFSQTLILWSWDTDLYVTTWTIEDSEFISPYGISSTLVAMHLIIGFGKEDSNDEDDVMLLIKKMKEYIQLDILSLLEMNIDKERVLDLYLASSYWLISDSSLVLSNYKVELQEYDAAIVACNDDKLLADKEYFTAFQDYDYDFMQESLLASIDAQRCVNDNKIKFNATSVISHTLDVYAQVLSQKYEYLAKNQDMIVSHFPLLKPQLLEELATITAVLEQFADSKSE